MRDVEDSPEEAQFRLEVRAFLQPRLQPRQASHQLQIMGAGSDDLESGRRFLHTLAEGGFSVPALAAPPGRPGGDD